MEKITRLLVSQDVFGEPLSVNFNSESRYKTGLGAFFSIAIKSFMLVFTLIQFASFVEFQDPQISQVSFSGALT